MDRKGRSVEVSGGQTVEVYELTVNQIMSIAEEMQEMIKPPVGKKGKTPPVDNASIGRKIQSFLPLATNLSAKDFGNLTPSEVIEIAKAFQEVNRAFFVAWRRLLRGEDLTEILTDLILSPESSEPSATSSQGATPILGVIRGAGS